MTWQSVFERINEYRSRKNNWDGLGALCLSFWTAHRARQVANTLRDLGWPVPECGLSTNGTIKLEWYSDITSNPNQSSELAYCEIEIDGDRVTINMAEK